MIVTHLVQARRL